MRGGPRLDYMPATLLRWKLFPSTTLECPLHTHACTITASIHTTRATPSGLTLFLGKPNN